MTTLSRRVFLGQAAAGAMLGYALSALAREKKSPKILLRSAWQTVNIGDIAHTPGVLALIEKHIPGAELWLWPSKVDNGVDELLHRRFPKLTIVQDTPDLIDAWGACDFLLHGSGPSLVGANDVAKWKTQVGKPYGIYGITLSKADPRTLELINGARFTFFRDSVSLKLARDSGAASPIMEFGPDGAFAVDLRNDAAAEAFLKAKGLEPGRFLCCIGRLRNTPYWKIHNRKMTAEDERKHAVNEAKKEQDHLALREAIVALVRQTGMKVLVCPEDQSQMAVGKELLVDPLPEDVRKSVVWRDTYWLTDEALSVYARSAGLFGNEMHSPIMCVGNGVPAVVCRWVEQTSKGYMWQDIGLGDWLFDLDQKPDSGKIVQTVLSLVTDREGTQRKVAAAQEVVRRRQAETMRIVAESVPA